MTFEQQSVSVEPLGSVSRHYLADETELVARLADRADAGEELRRAVSRTAMVLVESVRRHSTHDGGIDAFLQQYDLSSEEGVLLMCIAEALLRIPDAATADRLIADKLTSARWEDHLGASESLFVNASTWGLMLTGRMLRVDEDTVRNPARVLKKLASGTGEPVVRAAMKQAMRIIGHEFVMGRTIGEALERAERGANRRFRYSYDMLGEAALTAADAEHYFWAYEDAIVNIGGAARDEDPAALPSISVKLSALSPRYEYSQYRRVIDELVPRVAALCAKANEAGIALTIDAEESERLELSLDVFERVFARAETATFGGLGLAVQAYQRRGHEVVEFVVDLARRAGRRIAVRLVKGAYWDTEIKAAQQQGLESYPVFTRKAHTDVSYLACARTLLNARDVIYPQFATHNAHTLASILHFADGSDGYEFQRLHGMGEELYADIVDADKYGKPCRVYAPVGSHRDLLPYLVRRLLENGANTSFVNRILDESVAIEDIVADPVELSRAAAYRPHGRIPDPAHIYGEERRNAKGFNLADRRELAGLLTDLQAFGQGRPRAAPIVSGCRMAGDERESVNPADTSQVVGSWQAAGQAAVDEALTAAVEGQRAWDARGGDERADVLERCANLYETNALELMQLCVREGGKTLPDAIAELREAVDFLRYYAAEARRQFGAPRDLPGPTGERNQLTLRGRGVFLCISPWNFPLAIFTGQIGAALVAGNAVLAKPAEQTTLVASRALELMLESGVPADVLHLLPGDGAAVGGYAASCRDIAGVAFTGSTETAARLQQTLAARSRPMPAFVAETGGLNAMFVDSSALPEQVVSDALYSAFNSAGQRCSALRILCIQKDVAPRLLELLSGHMDEMVVGDPADLATDVGPVIDGQAKEMLEEYVAAAEARGELINRCRLSDACRRGTFVAPAAIEIPDLAAVDREIFGPVLHVYRYRAKDLDTVIDAINAKGYGLTMGLHSRIAGRARAFIRVSGAGNLYINRNMVGAVVGVQPFGGRGLSGTGPKAGGPHYLARFATEQAISDNIAAVGGNASLLSLDDRPESEGD